MQQTAINLPSNSPVRAMSGLAKSLSLPAECAPQRLPSFPQLERTAVMGFNQPLAVAVLAADPIKVVLTRDAAFPFWHSATALNLGTYGLTYVMDCESSVSDLWRYDTDNDDAARCVVQNGSAPTTTVAAVTGGTSIVTSVPLGVDAGLGPLPFLFVPDNMSLGLGIVLGSGLLATQGCVSAEVVLERWVGPDQIENVVVSGLAVGAAFPAVGNSGGGYVVKRFTTNVDTGGWYRLKTVGANIAAAAVPPNTIYATLVALPDVVATPTAYTPAVGGVGAWTCATASQRVLLPYGIAPEFATSRIPYSSTRLTAVALLMTNVTQVLNKAGTVLAGRINPETISWGSVTQDVINALHPVEKAWLPLETGLYTYAPPGPDIAGFTDYTLNCSGTYYPTYQLANTAMNNVAFLTSPSAFELAATLTTQIEFKTSSALWTLGVSGYTLETLHVAQMALMASGFFFENPEHKSLLARIAAGIRKLEPYVTPVVTVAKAVHPPTGAVLSAAYNAARAFTKAAEKGQASSAAAPRKIAVKAGPMKVSTTTARASGILGGRRAPTRKKR